MSGPALAWPTAGDQRGAAGGALVLRPPGNAQSVAEGGRG